MKDMSDAEQAKYGREQIARAILFLFDAGFDDNFVSSVFPEGKSSITTMYEMWKKVGGINRFKEKGGESR